MENVLSALPNMTLLIATLWTVTSLVSLFTLGIARFRPMYPGWRTWSLGHAALVLGLLAGALRTPQTLMLSILFGNGLVMVGTGLFVSAFQRFSGEIPSRKVVTMHIISVVALLLVLVGFTVEDNLTARFLLASGYLVVQSMTLMHLFVRQILRHPHLRSAYLFNCAVLVSVQVLSLPRMLMLAPGKHPEAAFAMNVPNVLMYLSVLLFSIGGTFAFLVLHDDRRKQEVEQLHQAMTALAYNDPLTSLLNRRGIWEQFEQWSHTGTGAPAVLIVMDVDDFKTINDQQGHAVGDQCLKKLGALLQDIAHPSDMIGRLGGDEFALLLSGPPSQINQQLKQLSLSLGQRSEGSLGFSVSFGHTEVECFESLDEAMNRADEVMYRNKAARNALKSPAIYLLPEAHLWSKTNLERRRKPVARQRDRQLT
ncbi:GGDEF domain-containing protein [Deinococcus irradiatisoli]|uniref:GGDEF domain-containing protein n=1 Tax=Deinococcus irradiatisoli TaxID=2202254 RepID=A0A2Z3JH19_9DEIO|nr:GGDEF domain-containing protein [Deinococcus irradiatisoli]AWN22801.1 GGDEF domain-containing protein [Deinococcus irradiatisoli]